MVLKTMNWCVDSGRTDRLHEYVIGIIVAIGIVCLGTHLELLTTFGTNFHGVECHVSLQWAPGYSLIKNELFFRDGGLLVDVRATNDEPLCWMACFPKHRCCCFPFSCGGRLSR